MQIETVIADMGIGAIRGSVGTNVIEPVSMTLYAWASEAAHQQEAACALQ